MVVRGSSETSASIYQSIFVSFRGSIIRLDISADTIWFCLKYKMKIFVNIEPNCSILQTDSRSVGVE